MDRASLIINVRGMIAQNPVDLTYAPDGGTDESHDAGVANVAVSERQLKLGKQPSYMRSVWIIPDDWTVVPAKRVVVSMMDPNGEARRYRVLDDREYYQDTDGNPVALRLDLGAEYEMGRD